MFVPAKLNEKQLEMLRMCEQRDGMRLIALKDVPIEPKTLDDMLLHDIQALEKELGCTIVAVK